MRHVGLCSADGPEVKSGNISLTIRPLGSYATGTLSVDGRECSYSGRLLKDATGTVRCSGSGDVTVRLWLAEGTEPR
jgi:hypothetical protein